MSKRKLIDTITICGGITLGAYLEEQHCQACASRAPIIVKHSVSTPALPHEPLVGVSIPTSPGLR
jgi:hypothetical protein